MLKTAIVAMTIVGCDCDAKVCEYIRGEQPQWSTMAECEAALSGHVVREHHESYPTVIAVCSVPDQNARDRVMTAYRDAAHVRETAAIPEPTITETIVAGGSAIVSRAGGTATSAAANVATGTFSLVADSMRWVGNMAVSTMGSAR